MAAGNLGLTFIWIPQLFSQAPAGTVVLPVFFLALFFAALSSLIAMIELASRVLIDARCSRGIAVRLVGVATVICGIPSAVSPAIFENQDWVWGLALMISGLFISVAVTRYGPDRFRADLVNVGEGSMRVCRLFGRVLQYLIPAQFAIMFA